MHPLQTILLVEDEDDDREIFTSALKEIKGVVLASIAGNGKEAIELLHSSLVLPSIIFMDINMPEMDGIEFLRRIADDPLINEIPVIILSSEFHYSEQALKLGAAGFIKKQTSISALHNELERIFISSVTMHKI